MKGLELCGAFYAEVVAPLFGDLPHSAGMLGAGSEVLGFDDETSTDHSFGPRVFVFVTEDAATIEAEVDPQLPDSFRDFPTRFGDVYQRLTVTTVAQWTHDYLGFDATSPPTITDWLATPTQRLATVASGAVYHDGLDQLSPMRSRLAWYPDDVWRYILSVQWRRISQEDHFVGRTSMVGDALGSRLLAGRLARDLMRLAFLLERRHAPYVKWFGRAFGELAIAGQLGPALDAAVAAETLPDREAALVVAYELAMRATNALGLAAAMEPTVRPFFERGFLVTMGERFAGALYSAISDPAGAGPATASRRRRPVHRQH